MTAESHTALNAWLQAYHDSVGSPADECLQLYDRLRQGTLKTRDNMSLLQELLEVMSGLSPDPHTVSCAMLFVASKCGIDLEPIRADLSREVNDQLDQLQYLIKLESEHVPESTGHSAEGLRRMLLALIKDVRVVLIALAWQLVKLRRVKDQQSGAVALAREVMLIHAPLANRLGVWQLKWELEDLAFRYDQPEDYRRVAALVDERRSDRERFIRAFIGKLETTIEAAGIKGEVSSARAWILTSCLMSGRCVCWWMICPGVTAYWGWCIHYGNPFRVSSMITSPCPRAITTNHCIRLLSGLKARL